MCSALVMKHAPARSVTAEASAAEQKPSWSCLQPFISRRAVAISGEVGRVVNRERVLVRSQERGVARQRIQRDAPVGHDGHAGLPRVARPGRRRRLPSVGNLRKSAAGRDRNAAQQRPQRELWAGAASTRKLSKRDFCLSFHDLEVDRDFHSRPVLQAHEQRRILIKMSWITRCLYALPPPLPAHSSTLKLPNW